MMKVWDSVESLVDSLSLLSRRAIWSWPQKLITALPAMIPVAASIIMTALTPSRRKIDRDR
jgi:hypothetical protein